MSTDLSTLLFIIMITICVTIGIAFILMIVWPVCLLAFLTLAVLYEIVLE